MTVFLTELWIPIVLATLLCLGIFWLAWMVLPHHRAEWKRLPTEPDVLDALRKVPPPPGSYAFPFANRHEMERADVKLAFERGPVGFLTIAARNRPPVPKMVAQTTLYFLVVSGIAGGVAWLAAPAPKFGAPPAEIASVTFLVALLAYASASVPDSVWFGRSWRAFLAQLLDATACAAATAALFTWLWPQ